MHSIWRKVKGLWVVELKQKTYQFSFNNEANLKRDLKRSPWMFRNSWLILKRWECSIDPAKVIFNNVNVWIQLW